MTKPMTNTTSLENDLRRAYLHRAPVSTPMGLGVMTCWERFYEIPGLLDSYVDEIEVRTVTGQTYFTSDYTNLSVKE